MTKIPALLVREGKNLFRQFDGVGSQRKVSVCAPMYRVEMPNLTFKAPTYEKRDSSFFPARQGGNNKKYIRAVEPYLLSIDLTVEFLGGRIIIKSMMWLKSVVKNIVLTLLPLDNGRSGHVKGVNYKGLSFFSA